MDAKLQTDRSRSSEGVERPDSTGFRGVRRTLSRFSKIHVSKDQNSTISLLKLLIDRSRSSEGVERADFTGIRGVRRTLIWFDQIFENPRQQRPKLISVPVLNFVLII